MTAQAEAREGAREGLCTGGVGGVEAEGPTEGQPGEGRVGCAATGYMGRRLPLSTRACLASGSPDKGRVLSLQSTPDHRAVAGGLGARLWLWGRPTGGGAETPR